MLDVQKTERQSVGIVVDGAWTVYVTQDDNSRTRIEYSEFLSSKISAEVKENRYLYLDMKTVIGNIRGSDLVAYVNTPNIELIKLSGESDAIFKGDFHCEKCEINLSGASDLSGFDITVQTLDARLSGGSNVTISVEEKITGKISDASTLKYRGTADVSGVSVSGAGDLIQVK